MSTPPPPPQVSPDGKFYWDGQRWVPMQQGSHQAPQPVVVVKQVGEAPPKPSGSVGCVTRTTCLTVVAIVGALALVLLVAGICSSIASQH